MPLQLPKVMGHRGAAGDAPENTPASIRLAAEQGARWVEFDVMLTSDRRPVVFHDDSLKRTTGVEAMMAETPYARVKELEAGAWFGPAFEGQAVPTLEGATALAWSLGLSVNVEIKPTPGRDVETARFALETLAAAWSAKHPAPLLSSFSIMSLAVARVLQPDWPRGLLVRRVPKNWRLLLQDLDCASFHVWDRKVTRALVEQAKEAGYQVAVFTVNQGRRARTLLSWGVDCVISDYPGQIAEAVAQE